MGFPFNPVAKVTEHSLISITLHEEFFQQKSGGNTLASSIMQSSPEVIGEILNIVHNAVFLLDKEDRIVFANRKMEKMFRVDAKRLIGQNFCNLFMPDDQEILAPNILKITKAKQEFECETMLQCFDGSSFLGLMHCAFFKLDGDSLIATTIHDITKMKTIERMLRHSEHEAFLGNMLNDISHQIRNPILVIGGLAKRLTGDDTHARYGGIISKESRRLEAILDTLNDFIQLPRPQLNQVPLAELVTEVKKTLTPLCAEHGGELNCTIAAELLEKTMLIDLTLLLKAIEAAVKNSCEAYPQDTGNKTVTIQFIATSDATWPYAIKISDRGMGIAAEDMSHVTSHFFTKKGKHIGMGMTFAQRIINEQDGETTIDSVEGEGTTVTFFLKKERRRVIRTIKL